MQKRILFGIGILIAILIGVLAAIIRPAHIQIPSEEVCDFVDNDLDGEIDEGFATTCSADTDCGESGAYGDAYCQDGDVYTAWYQVDCIGEPGTCDSRCSSDQTQRVLEECRNGCNDGQCIKNS